MLLTASCAFYMAFIPQYIIILLATVLVDYVAGIYIEKTAGKKRKLFLVMSIVANIGVLGFFKYFNFFNENIAYLAQAIHWNYPVSALQIILPIGLSFHTFQAMSYTIEVYRGKQKAEKHLGIYALYVMFYPQLVAGPIERPQNLIHQFYEDHKFEYQRVVDGLLLMGWGMFKKVVIADRLAILVNQVYGSPLDYAGLPLIIATIFFAFQIYCDFSGYSDIAIGAAKVMGFKLMTNFDRPYSSRSIGEFWKRWHISLSTWFKDYVYFSMGGSKVSKWRWSFNVLVVFLISGLWHGANWTYIVWGALNGFYMIFSNGTAGSRKKFVEIVKIQKFPTLYKIIQVGITFGLVSFSWIFFRAQNMQEAFYIVSNLFNNLSNVLSLGGLKASISGFGFDRYDYLIAIISILIMEIVQKLQRNESVSELFTKQKMWIRWPAYYALVFAIILFGVFGQSDFIYFQF